MDFGKLLKSIPKEGAMQEGDLRLPRNKVDAGFLKLLQTMTAVNIKLKYELGERIAYGLHEMLAKNMAPEAVDFIDGPEVVQTAWDLYNLYGTNGWEAIVGSLGEQSQPNPIKNSLMSIAIEHGNIRLVRDLIKHKALFIDYDIYRYAVRKSFVYQTARSETIVDMIAKAARRELGVVPDFSNKLYLGLANIQIYDYITDHEFPMLERALREGLNPNTRIANVGNLLGISVMVKCYRCTKLLIEFGARIDVPLEYPETLQTPALEVKTIVPNGWSPLMVSVAYAHERVIKLLIDAGARVSDTPQGREDERFHSRAVARKIKDPIVRIPILSMLKPAGTELEELIIKTQGKDFLQVISYKSEDIDIPLLDTFLLISPTTESLNRNIPFKRSDIDLSIFETLNDEGFVVLE